MSKISFLLEHLGKCSILAAIIIPIFLIKICNTSVAMGHTEPDTTEAT